MEKKPILIKRYANRKLYDTSKSRYITLVELGELIHRGVNIQVLDNDSKEDLTQLTLTQVLIAQQKKGRSGLRKLVHDQAELLMLKISQPIQQIRGEAIKQVGRLTKKSPEELQTNEKSKDGLNPLEVQGGADEKILTLLLLQRIESLERQIADLSLRLEALERIDDERY